MFLQLGIAWIVLVVCVGLAVFGLAANGTLRQDLWDPVDLQRFLLFAAIYASVSAAAIRWIPRWYLPLVAVATFIYTGLSVGFVAPLAIGYFAAGCYAAGALWLRAQPEFLKTNPQLPIFIGLGMSAFFVMVTAQWQIHYRWLYFLLPAVAIFYAAKRKLGPNLRLEFATTRRDLVPLSVALFPLLCAWMAALKPEVSPDGLAMHMVIPARLAALHHWPFQVQEFIWAVMPMGGDWAYSFAWMLGGEPAAKLLNFAILTLISWTLYERLHARVPGWMTAVLVAGYLSTPLTQLETGSMFVENFQAAMLLGSILLLRIHLKERRSVFFLAFAFLAGVAAASKLGSWAYIAPLFVSAVVLTKFRHLFLGLPVLFLVGGYPYWQAWLRTSNPFFPMFNAWFRSAFYSQVANFRDPRFLTPLSKTTWYDITFHSSRFLEGLDGSMGLFFFLLVPVCLVAWRRRWPKTGKILLGVAITGCILTFLGQSYLRYLYPALPMFTLLGGIALASFRLHSERMARAIAGAAAAAFLVNLYLLPAAGPYHRDFALNRAFDRGAVDHYLTAMAPERKLVNWLKANDPQARVAWMESNAIADFSGPTLTNSWHSPAFSARLAAATSPESISWLAQDQRVAYFIAPSPGSWRKITNVHTREFLDRFSRPVTEAGGVELRRWMPPDPNAPSQPYAGPGTHNEVNSFVTFAGNWLRDIQFQNTLGKTLVYSNDTRSRLSIRFQGAAVKLIYTAAANRCQGLVSIDDGDPVPLNQYAATTKWQTVSPPFRAPSPGKHVLQFRFPQNRGKGVIAGCFLDLDGFIVE